MNYVALTPYNRPDYAFNFEGWQGAPQSGLPTLLLNSPQQATAALSTNSSPKGVIYSILLPSQPPRHNSKALA